MPHPRIYPSKEKIAKIDEKLYNKLQARTQEERKRGRPSSIRMESLKIADEYDEMKGDIERAKKSFPLFSWTRK